VGLLGSAYQRVDEMLSGYAQIPVNGNAPRPAPNGANGKPHANGNGKAHYATQHAGGEMKTNANRGRRRRRARPR